MAQRYAQKAQRQQKAKAPRPWERGWGEGKEESLKVEIIQKTRIAAGQKARIAYPRQRRKKIRWY